MASEDRTGVVPGASTNQLASVPEDAMKPTREIPPEVLAEAEKFMHESDSDLPIAGLSSEKLTIIPITLPGDGDHTDYRPIESHTGEAYRAIAAPDLEQHLMDQIGRLETEHFGLKRGFSTVNHAWQTVHDDGETLDSSYRRFVAERLPHVEAELDRLYSEHDEVLAMKEDNA